MRNIEHPLWQEEKRGLDFIDYVVLPVLFAAFCIVCIIALPAICIQAYRNAGKR